MFIRCFWADCESRRSYAYFGDAVVFDTTYNTNKYSMIFAPFVGVNNHRQTIIFGCGLLSDEKTDSFVWLFSKFLEAMPNQVIPPVIITDQDAAISRAILLVMPSTMHRYCLWHILNKFSEKINARVHNDDYHKLVNIIRQSETSDEFEHRWREVVENTELSCNEWLSVMYNIRSLWVPAYVKHVFAAGMSSSQQSESSHSFLKKYVNRKNSLMDFIIRFNRALSHQRHEELLAIHIDISERPRVMSGFVMEKQMAHIYTKKMFLLFQAEVEQSNFYTCQKRSSSDGDKEYVVQRFEPGKRVDRQRVITYYAASDFITCSCRMFEFDGYPCRHMISYMRKKQLMSLSDKYILQRWTKNAKVAPVFDTITNLSIDDGPCKAIVSRHGMLAHTCSDLIDDASLTDSRSTFLMGEFQSLKIRVKEIDSASDLRVGMISGSHRNDTEVVCDPKLVRAKGCGKRLKSSKEKALSQSSKKCGACGVSGHDRRTCPTLHERGHVQDNTYFPQYSYENARGDRSYVPYNGHHDGMYTSVARSNFETVPGYFNNHLDHL